MKIKRDKKKKGTDFDEKDEESGRWLEALLRANMAAVLLPKP